MRMKRTPEVAGIVCWYGSDRFPLGAELEVAANQCALFLRDGAVLGMVLAGRYRLTPEHIPFLGPILVRTPQGPELHALVCFVPIENYPGVEVRAQLGQLRGLSAPGFAIHMRTLVTLKVDDPFRLGAFLAVMPRGQILESAIEARLAPRLGLLVSEMAAEGEVPIGTIGGAALGAVAEALHAGWLSLEELGIQVVDVTALELRPDGPLRPASPPVAALTWGTTGITFVDGLSGRGVPVTAYGTFDGAPIPAHLHDWVRSLIMHALRSSASTYTGSLHDLPARAGEWSEWLTQAVAPNVERQTGVRGRVTVVGVTLPD